jgi:hypothetical protein
MFLLLTRDNIILSRGSCEFTYMHITCIHTYTRIRISSDPSRLQALHEKTSVNSSICFFGKQQKSAHKVQQGPLSDCNKSCFSDPLEELLDLLLRSCNRKQEKKLPPQIKRTTYLGLLLSRHEQLKVTRTTYLGLLLSRHEQLKSRGQPIWVCF